MFEKITDNYRRLMEYEGKASQKAIHMIYAGGAALGLAGMALIPGPQPLEDLVLGACVIINAYKCAKDSQQYPDDVMNLYHGYQAHDQTTKKHNFSTEKRPKEGKHASKNI